MQMQLSSSKSSSISSCLFFVIVIDVSEECDDGPCTMNQMSHYGLGFRVDVIVDHIYIHIYVCVYDDNHG